MIGPVHIQNYKSIRDLKLDAKRVNLFIGEPNSGKSNILEALSFFAAGVFQHSKEIFRFNNIADLFFDQKVTNELNVQAGDWEFSFKFDGQNFQGQFFQSEDPSLSPRLEEWLVQAVKRAGLKLTDFGFASDNRVRLHGEINQRLGSLVKLVKELLSVQSPHLLRLQTLLNHPEDL